VNIHIDRESEFNPRVKERWVFSVDLVEIRLISYSLEEKPYRAKTWKTLEFWSICPVHGQTYCKKPEVTEEILYLVRKRLCEIPYVQ